MKRLMFLLLSGIPALAQPPTYTLAADFRCDVSTTRPLTSFYQFDCRGPVFVNLADSTSLQLFWYNSLAFNIVQNGITIFGIVRSNTTINTPPANPNSPGVFQTQLQIQTADGSIFTGVWSGNWAIETSRFGPRPLILAGSTVQFDQSPGPSLN